MKSLFLSYLNRYQSIFEKVDWPSVESLLDDLRIARDAGRKVFIFGNGGSAANAMHWANDLLYPLTKNGGKAIRAFALTPDAATVTCLANDLGYEEIFSFQLRQLTSRGDLVIALSGSGNSPNVVKALEYAKIAQLKSYAIVGYNGGKAKELASVAIHFPVDDMQLAEDFQLMVCHLVLQTLQKEL